jgi:hypothetical protein
MKCRSCQAEIADKAIVCYRCGTPTADLPPVPKTAPPPSAGRPWWLLALVLVAVALAVWFAPQVPAESPLRWGIWVAVLALVVVAAARLARRR